MRTISLADTVGLAGPAQIRELFEAVNSKYDYLEIGLHLHSRPEQVVEKIAASLGVTVNDLIAQMVYEGNVKPISVARM